MPRKKKQKEEGPEIRERMEILRRETERIRREEARLKAEKREDRKRRGLERYYELRALGICIYCKRAETDKAYCPPCLLKMKLSRLKGRGKNAEREKAN